MTPGQFTLSKTLEKVCKSRFKNVSRNGDWVNFSCPVAVYKEEHKFKEDRSPSAGAIANKEGTCVWSCFTCKGAGNFINLLEYLQKKTGSSYQNNIDELAQGDYIPDYEVLHAYEEEVPPSPLAFTNLFEPIANFPEAAKYMADRGISDATIRKLDLQYNPDDPRIVFPVRDAKGTIFGFTSRTIYKDVKPKIKNYSGFQKEWFILGMEHWKQQPSIIVEGLFAYAHLHEITKGKYFPYNIGAIMGSSISKHQIDILIYFGQTCYPLLDPDPAGQAGMFGRKPQKDWSFQKRELERSKGMVIALKDHIPTMLSKWPEGIDDPDNLTYDTLYDMIQKSRLAL